MIFHCIECGVDVEKHGFCSRACQLRYQDRHREECDMTYLYADDGEAVAYSHGYPAPPGRRPKPLPPAESEEVAPGASEP